MKEPIKRRPKEPTKAFAGSFDSALLEIAAGFLKSERFKHAQTKGNEREVVLRELFTEHLPTRYSVATGEVVDIYDKHSPQLDVLIYDSTRNFAFYTGDSEILPAEALLVSVEVKSKLTKQEIKKSLIAAKKLRQLKPFKRKLSTVRKDGKEADDRCRYFHTLFAYDSDLAKDEWMKSEHARFNEVAREEGIDAEIIDRLYVPNRGMINLPFSSGLEEPDESGKALIHFYMHILNFLQRENGRREDTPYLTYAGRLTKGWKKL